MNEDNDEKIREAFLLIKEENIITRHRLDTLEIGYGNLYNKLEDLIIDCNRGFIKLDLAKQNKPKKKPLKKNKRK